MARKINIREEIDFENDGCCTETFESGLTYAVNRVKAITNPYVGNKRKVLFWILKTLKDEGLEYNRVLDLFSGSHCLSIVMKLMGKQVVCNDVLSSSHMYGVGFVENNDTTLSTSDIEFLLENRCAEALLLVPKYSVEYVDRFTPMECEFLANYYTNILKRFNNHESCLEHRFKRALAFASMQLYIMDHCFVGGRLNRGQILARVDHRLEHQRNQGREMSFRDIRWTDFNDENAVKGSSAIQMDASNVASVLSKDLPDLVYIDPPYGGEQSDYGSMYSFFEEYCGSSDAQSAMQSIGLKKYTKHKGYQENFCQMMKAVAPIPNIAISYNDSSWASIDHIKKIVEDETNGDVSVFEQDYDYKYRSSENKKGSEYLIIVRR